MSGEGDRILETVSLPDYVQEGDAEAFWYAVLRVRVVVQAGLLTWSEVAAPWRAR